VVQFKGNYQMLKL